MRGSGGPCPAAPRPGCEQVDLWLRPWSGAQGMGEVTGPLWLSYTFLTATSKWPRKPTPPPHPVRRQRFIRAVILLLAFHQCPFNLHLGVVFLFFFLISVQYQQLQTLLGRVLCRKPLMGARGSSWGPGSPLPNKGPLRRGARRAQPRCAEQDAAAALAMRGKPSQETLGFRQRSRPGANPLCQAFRFHLINSRSPCRCPLGFSGGEISLRARRGESSAPARAMLPVALTLAGSFHPITAG